MKKLLLVVIIMIGYCYPLMAINSVDSMSISMSFRDDAGDSTIKLLIGIHKDATHNVDTALGERQLFEAPPPDGIYAVLFITDSSDMSRYYSYIDFRPIPEEDVFVRYYRFKLFNLISSYTINWSKIGGYVDSAFIKDIATGNLLNVDMKAQESYVVENYGMDQFNVVIYYNKNLVAVNENVENNVKENIDVYPNPVLNELKFICNENIRKYKIFNSAGLEMNRGEVNEAVNRLEVGSYSPGLYLLMLEDNKGELLVKKFIKY